MDADFRQQVAEGGFKATREASDFCGTLKSHFGFAFNYDAARLCIGRSLADPRAVEPVSPGRECAAPIRGKQLFGMESLDLWICLILEAGGFGRGVTLSDFRVTVEAHWERGARLLKDEWEEAGHDDVKFLLRISDFLPEGRAGERGRTAPGGPRGAVTIQVGPVSLAHPSREPVAVTMNGPGVAPHMAFMGRNSSGKTTTGLHMLGELHRATGAPVLILDPKGDLFENGVVKPQIASLVPGIRGVELGVNPVPLDFLPPPDVGSVATTQAAMRFRDTLLRCFKISGDIQQDNLRQAVEQVISGGGPRDLVAIRSAYTSILTRAGQQHDSVLSKLNELTALRLFEAAQPPESFFSTSWVIGMSTLRTEELKRLANLLLLDTLSAWILSQSDSPAPAGYRQIRHILFIDEARRILSERRYQSLVDLLRQGRSKGATVMLISQDPSDFHGQADDFTTQLGTVVAFVCTAKKGLRDLEGAYGRKLQPAEFSDSELPPGVAFVKLPNRQPERVQCWKP